MRLGLLMVGSDVLVPPLRLIKLLIIVNYATYIEQTMRLRLPFWAHQSEKLVDGLEGGEESGVRLLQINFVVEMGNLVFQLGELSISYLFYPGGFGDFDCS